MNKCPTSAVIARMKTNLIGFAVATAVVTSFSAFADHWDDDDDNAYHSATAVGAAPCQHDEYPSPAAYPQSAGHYELQTTQQWVADQVEQVYVPFCRATPWGRTRCHGGRYESRVIPGHSQAVEQQVWVADYYPPPQQRYTTFPRERPGQARIGFSIGFH